MHQSHVCIQSGDAVSEDALTSVRVNVGSLPFTVCRTAPTPYSGPAPKVAARREECPRDSAVFTAAAAAVAAAAATTPPTAAVRVAAAGQSAAGDCAVGGGGPRRLHRQRLGGRLG